MPSVPEIEMRSSGKCGGEDVKERRRLTEHRRAPRMIMVCMIIRRHCDYTIARKHERGDLPQT